jgi:hypothetical protein
MSRSEQTVDASAPGTDPTYIPSSESTSFIETSGGLLTEQTIISLRQERFDHPAVAPETFALPGETPPTENELEEKIALVWEDLVERWDEVTQKGRLFEMDISKARSKWILRFFEALDFEPIYQRGYLEVEGMEFDLSHKGWPDDDIADYGEMGGATAPVIHTITPERERDQHKENKLDRKPEGAGRGTPSPHDTLQNFLNASQEQVWALLTDGVTLRVLRDFYHTYTRGYVEFDLENIFTSRNYQDFRALYRLCHASRFLPRDKTVSEVLKDDRDEAAKDDESEIETPLEMLYQTSLSTGVKVGQDLQSNVISALETLGNGLLNPEIREFLRDGGDEAAQAYYQELLLLIYRLLFLLYAEQRGMMPGRDSLYADEYSITKLRERAERRQRQDDPNTDVWHGLQATFKLAEVGDEDLGVPAYNGMLFDSARLEHVSDAECTNEALLSAISDLTLIEREGVLQRISYADLGVEEVGSIYESLLEFTPRLATKHVELEDQVVPPGEFFLDDRGTERKETGSYYTNPQLVQELIKSALEPVVDDRLESADDSKEARETALLDIKVCDPACGSAAFLIAATNYLGKRLAQIREEKEYPLEDDVREARRLVLQHCIYGVDLNPMAIELAKLSLWIDSAVEDKPLNFLDHHIKCGNSLLGATQGLVDHGVPVDAFETSKGREGHVGNEIRKRVRQENRDYSTSDSRTLDQYGIGINDYASYTERLNSIAENSTDDIHEKERLYAELQNDIAYRRKKIAYDTWTAAFFWPLDGSTKEYPTTKTVNKIRKRSYVSDSALQKIFTQLERTNKWFGSNTSVETNLLDVISRALQIAEDQRFFHWELEFPEIFNGSNSGFDCVLSNPPWEKIKLKEKEFFASRNNEIANATKSIREKLIKELEDSQPDLYTNYNQAKQNIKNQSKFFRNSKRFELTGIGDIDYYPLFCEHNRWSIRHDGKLGMITPTGIVTDYYNQDFVYELVSNKELESLFDFDNRGRIFDAVAGNVRFSLLTLSGEGASEITLACQLISIEDLYKNNRRYKISHDDIKLVHPNSLTLPMFKSVDDAQIVLSIQSNAPILLRRQDDDPDLNPWGVEFLRMFDMTNDSSLFRRPEDLEQTKQSGPRRINSDNTYLPLYESKFCDQFNHRQATFEGIAPEKKYKIKAGTNKPSIDDLKNPNWLPLPRYYVSKTDVHNALSGYWDYAWLIGFRHAISAVGDARSVKFTVVPRYGVSNTMPLLFTKYDSLLNCGIIANFNSFILDYVARQKVSSGALNYHIMRQLPVIPPERYSKTVLLHIVPRVFELTYTSWDLVNFADDVWREANDDMRSRIMQKWQANADATEESPQANDSPAWIEKDRDQDESFPNPPFIWDDRRRERICAQLDACYAHIYGISREELEYILEQFPIVKRQDKAEHGAYRTKRLILDYYDEYEGKFELPEVKP